MPILLLLITCQFPAHAESRYIDPKNVLSVVTADWNEDGGVDRAVLAVTEDDSGLAELFLYLSDASAYDLSLSAYNAQIAWVGALWGTLPSLSIHKTGSLVVTSENQSIGRNRWTQKLTVAYRHNTFVVAGYTYSAYDTLDPAAQIECDVNLLTGKGLKNGKPFTTPIRTVAVTEWSESLVPKECRE